jgi:hypothetical protein
MHYIKLYIPLLPSFKDSFVGFLASYPISEMITYYLHKSFNRLLRAVSQPTTGSVNVTLVPSPALLYSVMLPFIASTSLRAI